MPGKLTYFPLGIRAEPIRAVLHFAGQEFEDNRISQDDFAAIKSSLPLGSLPVWEEDGIQYAQSGSILRMLGIRNGYYTSDPNTAWEIDSLIDFMEENFNDFVSLPAKPVFGATAGPEDREKFDKYCDKVIPILEGRLARHGKKYIAGTDNMTIADLKVYQSFGVLLWVDACPAPQDAKDACQAKIDASPKLKVYIAQLKQDMQPWISARVPTPL